MKKLVNVYANKPFKMNNAMFCGLHRELVLDTKQIQACIEHKARVEEVLKDGTIVPLGFDNFDEVNGVSSVNDNTPDSLENSFKEPKVEVIGKNIKKVEKIKSIQSYNLKNKTSVNDVTDHVTNTTVPQKEQKQNNNSNTKIKK